MAVSSWLNGSCGALGASCLQEGGKVAPSTTGTFQEKAHITSGCQRLGLGRTPLVSHLERAGPALLSWPS